MRDRLAYTIAEAAEAAATGRTALYEAIASGDLPARKRGRRTLVLAVDLRAWLEKLPALELKRTLNLSDALSQDRAEQVEPNDKRRVDGPISAEREGRDLEATRLERDTKAKRWGPSKRQSKGHPTPMRGA
jgi:excisionase family DNA binding protein